MISQLPDKDKKFYKDINKLREEIYLLRTYKVTLSSFMKNQLECLKLEIEKFLESNSVK